MGHPLDEWLEAGETTEGKEELRRLRSEVHQLKMQREILEGVRSDR